MKRLLSSIALLSLLATACSHTVIIDSDPSGAEVKVNGERLGTTPVSYTETTGWEKVYEIEAAKPGYKATRKQVKQTEWNIPIAAGSALGGLICLIPFGGLLWARQMPDRVVVSMEQAGAGDSAAPPSSSYGY